MLGLRRENPYTLFVGMVDVRMGDRIVQIGCANGGRLAAIAGKVGLSGHAVAIAPDEASAARARKGATEAGVLVEVETAAITRLPLDDNAFDLVVVDETGGLFTERGARGAFSLPLRKCNACCGQAAALCLSERLPGGSRRTC